MNGALEALLMNFAADVKAIAAREKGRPWSQFQRDRIRRAIEASTTPRGDVP